MRLSTFFIHRLHFLKPKKKGKPKEKNEKGVSADGALCNLPFDVRESRTRNVSHNFDNLLIIKGKKKKTNSAKIIFCKLFSLSLSLCCLKICEHFPGKWK